jgi:NADP-dependent 3-hydroxy acid dehydrogenase YdfG
MIGPVTPCVAHLGDESNSLDHGCDRHTDHHGEGLRESCGAIRVLRREEPTMTITADLSDRTAIVTGASSGIGRAIAERLGAAGAHVILSGRTAAAMEESAGRIGDAGGRASVVVGDVRTPGAVDDLVATAMDADGHLDILVNNAGISFLGGVLDGDTEQWQSMFDVNVIALLNGTKAAVAAMRSVGNRGHIVNVSSVAALRPDSGVYGATKHAVNVICNSLRNELLDDPIQVVSIMPGLVATNIGRNADPELLAGIVAMSGLDAEIVPGERLPDEVLTAAQAALSDIMVAPDDVADAVLYAVTRPAHVHIPEIVIRPNKNFDF